MLTSISAVGWRWFYWLCTVVCGLIFLAVVFTFPETRFERALSMPVPEGVSVESSHTSSVFELAKTTAARAVNTENVEEPLPNHPFTTHTRSSYLQMLSLYSGTPKEPVLSIVIRPVFMVAYPAVLYVIIGCKTSQLCMRRN